MNAGKITAKIRDAVPVCLIVEGQEVRRYKNIQLPDEIKATEICDFRFDIAADGKITFHLLYEAGALPETLPADRPLVTRADKAAAKAATLAADTPAEPAAAPTPDDAPMVAECTALVEILPSAPTADDAATTPTPVTDAATIADAESEAVEIAPEESKPAKKRGRPAKADAPSADTAHIEATAKRQGRPAKATAKK